MFQLLVAHEQFSESVEPAMASFHHPASGLLLWIALLLIGLALAAHHLRDIAVGQDYPHGVLAPVPGISTQVLGAPL